MRLKCKICGQPLGRAPRYMPEHQRKNIKCFLCENPPYEDESDEEYKPTKHTDVK